MIKLKISGLDAKLKFFDSFAKELEPKIGNEIKMWANNTAADAARRAPKNEGILRNSIKPSYTSLHGKVVVGVDYAAYLEFGTRRFAAQYVNSLPNDWKTFAASFKGKGGGSFEELVMRITRWVQQKGIGQTYNVKTRRRDRVGKQSAKTTAEADAYAIALHIVRNGIRPQPYLFPADREHKKILIENIKKITGAKHIKLS